MNVEAGGSVSRRIQVNVLRLTHIVVSVPAFYGQRDLAHCTKLAKIPMLDVLMVAAQRKPSAPWHTPTPVLCGSSHQINRAYATRKEIQNSQRHQSSVDPVALMIRAQVLSDAVNHLVSLPEARAKEAFEPRLRDVRTSFFVDIALVILEQLISEDGSEETLQSIIGRRYFSSVKSSGSRHTSNSCAGRIGCFVLGSVGLCMREDSVSWTAVPRSK